jgi:hypothetical protein
MPTAKSRLNASYQLIPRSATFGISSRTLQHTRGRFSGRGLDARHITKWRGVGAHTENWSTRDASFRVPERSKFSTRILLLRLCTNADTHVRAWRTLLGRAPKIWR